MLFSTEVDFHVASFLYVFCPAMVELKQSHSHDFAPIGIEICKDRNKGCSYYTGTFIKKNNRH